MKSNTDTAVADDFRLLDALIADEANAPQIYRPTAYWTPYAARIIAELRRSGFKAFRRNQVILKGYASGGTAAVTLPHATWKRAVWQGLSSLPGVSRVLDEHRRIIHALSMHLRRSQSAHARLVLDRIAERFPHLRIPAGLANGGADDAFEWRGSIVTSDFVMYLARTADIYAVLDPAEVASILEVGPGLGLNTLAHIALNPNLTTVVNVDIVPTIYVSGRFLASSPDVEVVEYSSVRGNDRIEISGGAKRVRVYALPSWMLPRVAGTVDLALNAFSFQEMEEEVCAQYAKDIARLTTRAVMLHSSIAGHKAQAGGQKKPVTMKFLDGLFAEAFPERQTVGGIWTNAYDEKPELAVLHTRKRAGTVA